MEYHKVKCLPEYFEQVCNGTKKFEVRKNDRDYQSGDMIQLLECDLKTGFTGRSVEAIIGYVLADFTGLAEGFVAFSLVQATHAEKQSCGM